MQAIPGCELIESDSLGLHHAPLSNPMFSGAWKTRISPGASETMIDEVLLWFKQRKAPYFFWWTDGQTRPVDLAERLLRRGFDGNLEGDPGMVAALHLLKEDVQPPNGFNLIQARDRKSLADWRDARRGWRPPAVGQHGWTPHWRSNRKMSPAAVFATLMANRSRRAF
jgi:hypothetical protein